MKKYILFFFLPVLLIGLHACDEGRIYENAVVATGEGRTVKMTGRISGVDKWSGDYSVVVAGFDDESDYAIVSKVVPASESDNDEIQLTMSGITDEVTTVELCVINKLRKRIVSLVAMECTEIADTILIHTTFSEEVCSRHSCRAASDDCRFSCFCHCRHRKFFKQRLISIFCRF